MSNFNYDLLSVNGILRKSHPKSKMVYRDLTHGACEFDPYNPSVYVYEEDRKRDIVVLQVMLCNNNYVLIEYVETKDF
jgi:hypothetical protein